ncbi:MAG: hypothetical protein QOD40_44 [Alphaproteobacteria bacterium]|jgi:hypothetical protein|nr:hypothetical protein [Alphaproteobacteria bacterium]
MSLAIRSVLGGAILLYTGSVWAADTATRNVIDRLEDAGFSLRQKISGPVKPATFSYEKTAGESFVAAEFAFLYVKFDEALSAASKSRDLFFRQFAVEGNLGGAEETRKNSFLRFSGSLANYHYADTNSINGFYQRIGPVYEATKKFSLENAYGEYEFVPVYDAVGVGVYKALLPGVYYQLLPSFVFNYGRNVRHDIETFEKRTTILRAIPYQAFNLSFSDLSKSLGFSSIIFNVTNKTTYLPLETQRLHNYLETSLDFGLTKNVHLVASYSRGREAPTYIDTPDFAVKFGIQFGKGHFVDP